MTTQSQALQTQEGATTPLSLVQPTSIMNLQMKEEFQSRIEDALNAKPEDFQDVTPIYWEARQGEEKIMVFLGCKLINKKDDAGNVVGQDFAVVFFDGTREVVCNQIALKDAMKSKQMGDTFKIKCIQAVSKQAKKFEILQLK